MNKTLLLFGAVALFASSALAQEATLAADVATAAPSEVVQSPMPLPVPEAGGDSTLYSNGPLANSIGTAPGGLDESIIQGDEGLFGYGAQNASNNVMADDFTIPTGETWAIDSIAVFAYQSFAGLPPTISGVFMEIYDGDPSGGAATVIFGDQTTNILQSVEFSDVYRNNATGNTDRAIIRVVADVDTALTEGTYWLAFSYTGDTGFSGPWQPPVPQPLGQVGCAPVVGGGAQQSTGGGAFALALNGTCESDLPFVIYEGVVNPAVEAGPATTTFALGAPRPNPASNGAAFSLDVEATQHVRAEVYDALGRSVAVLFDGTVAAGATATLSLDTAELPVGVYVVRVTGDSGWTARQVTVAR